MVTVRSDKKSQQARVRFVLPAQVEADAASVVGDFNDWDDSATLMKRQKDGSWSASVLLPPGKRYEFRYRLRTGMDVGATEDEWFNDDGCERCSNPFGTENSVITT